jgi:hypothetical protein
MNAREIGMTSRNALSIALLALLAGVSAPSAVAQSDSDATAAPSATAPEATAPDASAPGAAMPDAAYSDAELRAFGEAAIEIQRLRVIYALKLQATDDENVRAQVMEAAMTAMTGVVEQHGMSAARFHEILRAARSQPDLVDRINRKLDE